MQPGFAPFGASSQAAVTQSTNPFALPTMPTSGTPAVALVGLQSQQTAWYVKLGTAGVTVSVTDGMRVAPGTTRDPLILSLANNETHIAILCEGEPGTVIMTAGALFAGDTRTIFALSNSPTGGVGYSTGAGGTVTQATNKSTGVTLSKVTGQITMNNAALAAGAIVSFVLTNTAIAAGDILALNHVSAGTPGAYTLNARCAAGSATIDVQNNTAGSLSEAIVIGFVLIKGATT